MPDCPRRRLALALFSWLVVAGSAGTTELCQDQERPGRGEILFRVHCAACHGEDGKGGGPMKEVLRVSPRDLTDLERAGISDQELMASIDGRATVRGHGSSSMPVWGLSFRESGRDTPQEAAVRERLRDLLCYLKTLQPKKAAEPSP